MGEIITTTEAAKILDLAPDTVRHLIRHGRLPANKPQGWRDWQIKKSDVEKLAAQRKKQPK